MLPLVVLCSCVLGDRSPKPTGPPFPLTFTSGDPSFDIEGVDGSFRVTTSSGYSALLRVGGTAGIIVHGAPAEIDGVRMSVAWTLLAQNAAVLAFKLENADFVARTADIAVTADTRLNSADQSGIWTIPGQRGFIVSATGAAFAWALRDYPLVTNVSSYWFGNWADLYPHNFTQTDQEELEEGTVDTAQAFAWQGVSVPAGGFTVRSVIAKFGDFESNTLSLNLEFQGITNPLHYRTPIAATGSVTATEFADVRLIVIVDDDFTTAHPVSVDISLDSDIAFNFSVEDFGVQEGTRKVAFYAVDSDGNVAGGSFFEATVIAPTATASKTPDPSTTPTPHPTQSPAPNNVLIELERTQASFSLFGLGAGSQITTSFSGYSVLLRVGDEAAIIEAGSPAVVAGVRLSFHPLVISGNAILLAFRAENLGGASRVLDVGVSSDVYFDGVDGAPVTEIERGIGFVLSSRANAFSFVLRESPLVADVSSFWFGARGAMAANNWTQTTANAVVVSDSAVTFSWQGIGIAPGGRAVVSALARFGVHDRKRLELTLNVGNVPDSIFYRTTIAIAGRVTSPVDGESVHFVVTVGDASFAFQTSGSYRANAGITVTFVLGDYGVREGRQTFTLHAVDDTGNVSPGVSFTTTVIAPTIAVTHTPSPSATPQINVAIALVTEPLSFDIVGTIGTSTIRTTWWGYRAVLQTAGGTEVMANARPVTVAPVTMSLAWRHISANALLLSLHLANVGEREAAVNISVSADINFDGYDGARCNAIGGGHGFAVWSHWNALTFVTGAYPFVDDVSTFWFGDVNDLARDAWTQVTAPSYVGTDSAMVFTWQGVTVPARDVARRSVIVRFGGFESSQIALAVAFPRVDGEVSCLVGLEVTGTASVVGSSRPTGGAVRLFIRIDGNAGSLAEIEGEFVIDQRFTVSIVAAEHGVRDGSHAIELFAVDADGNVSPGASGTFAFNEGGISKAVLIAVSVVGGIGVVGAIALLVRCLRRRKFGKPEEMSSAPPAPGAEPLEFLEDQLLPE